MLSFKEFLQEKYGTTGTYAALKFDQPSTDDIEAYQAHNKIPNPVPSDKLHVTLLYSRRHMAGFKPRGRLESLIKARVAGFDVWDTQDGKKALVARLDAPELVARHRELMDKYNGTYDFPEYKPHTTLSYDVGPDFDHQNLPPFGPVLTLDNEFGEDLDLDWKAD